MVMTGLALSGAIVGLSMTGNVSLAANATCTLASLKLHICHIVLTWPKLSFLFLTIASAVTTAIIITSVDVINLYGNDIGVTTYKGNRFMGMTWIATCFMFLGFASCMFTFIRGRRKGK
jgi:hypothetical protein